MAGNGIQLAFSFERTTASPLDFYNTVADSTARDAIPSGLRHLGLKTFSVADGKTYVLKAGVTNSDWVEDGGGATAPTATDSLTAHAGGGQGSALALTTDINRVTTVATAGDSVKLPAATVGKTVIIIHDGAKSMDVFPASGEVINSLATNAAFAMTTAMRRLSFICLTAGTWRVNLIGTPDVFGSTASPRLIVIATGIVSASGHMSTRTQHQMIFVKGSVAGENIITASPPIELGLTDGAVMEIFGQDTTDYITLVAGSTGLDISGDWSSTLGSYLRLVKNGTVWFETNGRRV